MNHLRADRFLRAGDLQPVDVTPIWMMRQAGRSLPAYRALRAKYGFLELLSNPELCVEVTLMPMDVLNVDAAIIFADMMTPVAALGIEYDIADGIGPVVAEPIRSGGQVDALKGLSAAEAVPELLEAIKLVRGELEGVAPLIGFAGAPFTLASYLVEGSPSRDFSKTRALIKEQPAVWGRLMDRLTDTLVDYLEQQVHSGVQAFQLFDSWVGALSREEYERDVLPYSKRVFDQTARLGVPRIHFGTGTAHLVDLMASAGSEVLGVDWRIPLDEAWATAGDGVAVQGNLDPNVLLGSPDEVKLAAADVLRQAGGRPGHIFNLGHGVLPETPVDNLRLLVDFVHAETH